MTHKTRTRTRTRTRTFSDAVLKREVYNLRAFAASSSCVPTFALPRAEIQLWRKTSCGTAMKTGRTQTSEPPAADGVFLLCSTHIPHVLRYGPAVACVPTQPSAIRNLGKLGEASALKPALLKLHAYRTVRTLINNIVFPCAKSTFRILA